MPTKFFDYEGFVQSDLPDTMNDTSRRRILYRPETRHCGEPGCPGGCRIKDHIYLTAAGTRLVNTPYEEVFDRPKYACPWLNGFRWAPRPTPLHPTRGVTRESMIRIVGLALRIGQADAAATLGISDDLVHDIVREVVPHLDLSSKAARLIGIDEKYHDKSKRRAGATIVDVGTTGGPILFLPGRTQAEVEAALAKLPDREIIEAVVTDLCDPYRQAVRNVLTDVNGVCQVVHVADRYHVVDLAQTHCNTVRKDRNGTRGEWRGQGRSLRHEAEAFLMRDPAKLSPKQGEALECLLQDDLVSETYHLKQRLGDLYKSYHVTLDDDVKIRERRKIDATAALVRWMEDGKHLATRLDEDGRYQAKGERRAKGAKTERNPIWTLLESISEWSAEILAWWDYPITNGKTEAYNDGLETLRRRGRRTGHATLAAMQQRRTGRLTDAMLAEGVERACQAAERPKAKSGTDQLWSAANEDEADYLHNFG